MLASTPSKKCQDAIQLDQQMILMNSGHSITGMGLFDECIKEKDMQYGLLAFINSKTLIPVGIEMGLCFPYVCTPQEIEDVANQALASAEIPFITRYFPSPQIFEPQYNFAFYFTVILLSICLLCIAASSLVKFLRKNKIVGAFQLQKSLHIFKYKQHKFNVFNGIKTFCMMWVILGHLYSVRIQNNVNELTVQSHVEGSFFLWVLAAFFAVDVFFYIGGFLVAYSFLRNQMKSVLKYPLAIVHRVLRFWPSYIMAMMIYYGIFIHTGSGPLWFRVQAAGQIDNCATMYKPIFFVDNIVDNGESMCMGWGWYLQNDMQIFIVSIPILFLYNKSRKWAFASIWILIALSLIYNFLEAQLNEYITVAHRIDFAKWNSYFPNVYIKPWTRCPPYLYGLTLGLLYMEFVDEEKKPKPQKGFFMRIKEKMQNSRNFKNISQLIGLLIILFIVYIVRTLQVGYKWPQFVHSLYLATTKLLFVIGVSLLVTPALLGIKNDMVFFLMDTKFFHYVGKISFWTYLIHYMFILHVNYTQRIDFYYDVTDVFSLYLPVAILSMIFGALGTVVIQVPFAKLEQMLFKRPKTEAEVIKATQHVPMEPSVTLLTDSILQKVDSKSSGGGV